MIVAQGVVHGTPGHVLDNCAVSRRCWQVSKKGVRRFIHRRRVKGRRDREEDRLLHFFTIFLNVARADFEFSNISEFIAYVLGVDAPNTDSDSGNVPDVDDIAVSDGADIGPPAAGSGTSRTTPAGSLDSANQNWTDLTSLAASSEGFVLGLLRVRCTGDSPSRSQANSIRHTLMLLLCATSCSLISN